MTRYICIDFNIEPYSEDAADLLAAFLADIGFDSFEPSTSGLKAYITAPLFNEETLKDTISGFPMPVSISWQQSFIEAADWNAEWEKNYFKPQVMCGGRCVIHSTFHTDYPAAEYEIIIDPKMAFGTGHHATTSMMLTHLLNANVKGKKVVDMGTGTGILAILCAKLGAADVAGIEIDEGAFHNAIENAQLNSAGIRLLHGDARLLQGITGVDLFLANINRNIILADIENYVATLAPDATLLLSGFYQTDIPLVEAALTANGMKIADTLIEGPDSWASIKTIFA